jgi:hypothetical protein
VNEPYNYFGLKVDRADYNWAMPLSRIREFMRHPSENIILGDSRMNHFDLDYIENMTGERYSNLASGGQALNLSRELYDWAKQRVEIKKLLINDSFWQTRANTNSPSAESVFLVAKSPLLYMTTRDYVLETFVRFVESIKKSKVRIEKLAVFDAYSEPEIVIADDSKYREDLVDYALNNIFPGCQNYSLGAEQMADIEYILSDANENGISTIVVIPPVQASIWELVIEPLEIYDDMEIYKRRLMKYSVVYDMEWLSEFAKSQDLYADGFHLQEDRYFRFTNAIFMGDEEMVVIREKIEGR